MEDQLAVNKKRSEENQKKINCPKCGEPQFVTQFTRHVRNCDE